MKPVDQIPLIDASVAKLDKRINKAQATIWKLEDRVRVLLKRIERARAYSRELGKKRSRVATFNLDMD